MSTLTSWLGESGTTRVLSGTLGDTNKLSPSNSCSAKITTPLITVELFVVSTSCIFFNAMFGSSRHNTTVSWGITSWTAPAQPWFCFHNWITPLWDMSILYKQVVYNRKWTSLRLTYLTHRQTQHHHCTQRNQSEQWFCFLQWTLDTTNPLYNEPLDTTNLLDGHHPDKFKWNCVLYNESLDTTNHLPG